MKTKNILIPTDFSLESLNIVKTLLSEAVSKQLEETYHIVFITGYDKGDSIRDLLFQSDASIIQKLKTNEFNEALGILKNKYAKYFISSKFILYNGYFQSRFNQVISCNKIDEIYFSATKPKSTLKNIFCLNKNIKKCELPKYEIQIETPIKSFEKERLAGFFS
ncbi:hypothetical protein [Flavobacterium sp. I3-2]|uniref:hypothetical protein n=1 Tax=Flavobacterium sp. I3-2 TaxID=2748319 RepID=UPI0015AE3890|nr:hypothetical protein [Flavobacterium sp. I3-2]